jgi:hypothetical protein
MSASGDSRSSYLVECYWPGVSEQKLAAAVARAHAAASRLRREGGDVEFLGSILVPADETVFYLFEGREADVTTTSMEAAIPFERVLESLRIDGRHVKEEEQ